MKTILITGGNGYLASLVKEALQNDYHIISMTRKDADFSDPQAVANFIESKDFDYLFHTAAMAQTKDCEEQPELTHRVNVESTKVIVDLCKQKNARLIFSSTEQCFNGKLNKGPYDEKEPLEAITKYGQHKIECEDYIKANAQDYIILRYSWMLGLSRPNVKASPNIIQNVMKAMFYQTPTLFTVNEIRGMTYAQLLADQFEKIMELPVGIYHISDTNTHNTYEAAKIVAAKLGFEQEAIDTYILPNHERYQDRFRDYRLANDKIAAYGIHFGTFEENVDKCLADFKWLK